MWNESRTTSDAFWHVSVGQLSGLTPNQQLQRTVTRPRVRAAGAALPLCACGAHDMLSRGR